MLTLKALALKAIWAVATALKALLLPFAAWWIYQKGRIAERSEQDRVNTEALKEYERIEQKTLTGEELEKRLDEGSI